MEKSQKVFNLIILDESGSMESCKKQTISGFNEVVQTIKEISIQHPEQEQSITFVTFNGSGIKTHLFNETSDQVREINSNMYVPNSSTPLYDAIGFSISKLKVEVDKHKGAHVLVTILTDGEENSSHEYNGKTIKNLIEKLKIENWTFTYIGTEHDVDRASMSISINNTLNYLKSPEQFRRMFLVEKNSRIEFNKKILANEDVNSNYFVDDSSTETQ